MLRRFLTMLALLLPGLLLAGCGQVITRVQPTAPASATPAPATTALRPTIRPTSTPAPYTPAPSPTPTSTATPVVYKVQRGDNLMSIAERFNVSVSGIQDANKITDPRSLRVGQPLLIPVEADLPDDETPTPPPTPLPFAVANLSFGSNPLGGLWCFGEVENTTGVDLEEATVRVTLLDTKDQKVAEVEQVVLLPYLRPGERSSFALQFPRPAPEFSSYLAVPAGAVQGFPGSYYFDLDVRELSGGGERYTTYSVNGKVSNVGPEDAVEVEVYVTLYDAIGRVIGTRTGVPEYNVIPKGGETQFSLELTPLGGPVDRFDVRALGHRLPTPSP